MKIFVVVGTLFPFDRLIEALDHWVPGHSDVVVFGQIGNSKYIPKNFDSTSMLPAKEFNRHFEEADLLVTHAGMGIVLKALVTGKPIVVVPRKFHLNEHTTDHQMATTKSLKKRDLVHIAWEIEELLDFLKSPSSIGIKGKISPYANDELISFLKSTISEI